VDAAAAAMAAAAKINAELAKKAPVRQGEVPIIRQVLQQAEQIRGYLSY
jgi:serine protease inhibitor ecotin